MICWLQYLFQNLKIIRKAKHLICNTIIEVHLNIFIHCKQVMEYLNKMLQPDANNSSHTRQKDIYQLESHELSQDSSNFPIPVVLTFLSHKLRDVVGVQSPTFHFLFTPTWPPQEQPTKEEIKKKNYN